MSNDAPRFESTELLGRLAARVPSLLAYVDTEMRYVYANAAYHSWLGAADGALRGCYVRRVLGDGLLWLDETCLHAALNGAPQRGERFLTSAENRHGRHFSLAYLPDLNAGVVCGVVVEVNDITDLKNAERQLRDEAAARVRASTLLVRREEALEEAQRLGQLGSWEWEIEPDIVTWSAQMYRMFGQDPSRLPPAFEEHAKLLRPESWEALTVAVNRCRTFGMPYCIDIQFTRVDGTLGWAEVRGEAIRDESDSVIGLRGTTQDVTDRREAEHYFKLHCAASVRRSIGELLSRLGETVRQLMNGAIGSALLAKRASMDQAQRDRWLDNIAESGEKLAEAFSEIELNALRDSHTDAALRRLSDGVREAGHGLWASRASDPSK